MNKFNIEISDNDVLYMNEDNGDIRLKVELLPKDIEINDVIKIHYKEDAENISHEYVVSKIDDEVELKWEKQLEESLLTERSSFDKMIDKSIKKGLKAEDKFIKDSKKLFQRDLEKGQHWKFYFQKPDGTYEEPKTLSEIRDYYRTNMSPVSPTIANAIVTDEEGFIIRRGLEDLNHTTIRKKDDEKITTGYSIAWRSEDIEKYKEQHPEFGAEEKIEEPKTSEEPQKTETNDDKQESSNSEEAPSQQVINKKIIDKFIKLAIVAGLQVWDEQNRVVNLKKEKLTPENLSNYKIRIDNTLYKLQNWMVRAMKEGILTESFDIYESAETLLEAPLINLGKEDLWDPSEVKLKDVAKRAIDKENAEKAAAELQIKKDELKQKYSHVENLINLTTVNKYFDLLDDIFNELVPDSGKADSVGGELVRALMRVLYRYYNDGDMFFMGYGMETCGSSITYLKDQGFKEEINEILEKADYYANNEDDYAAKLKELTVDVVRELRDNPDLMYTPNNVDSRELDYNWLEDYEPKYDIDIDPSYEVDELLDKGIISYGDVYDYVYNALEYEPELHGCEFERGWGAEIIVSNLTIEGYDRVKELIRRDSFWQDLVDEYADELEDEEDYDDEYPEED